MFFVVLIVPHEADAVDVVVGPFASQDEANTELADWIEKQRCLYGGYVVPLTPPTNTNGASS